MPPARRKTTANRCVYKENGRRCPKPGQGNPPLCISHRLVINEAANPAGRGSAIPRVIRDLFRGTQVSTDDIFAAGFEVLGAVLGAKAARGAASGSPGAARAPGYGFPFGGNPAGFPFGFDNPPPPGSRPPPPPPAPYSDEMELAKARGVMGFKLGQKITVDQVKQRKRELARKHHPDRGGSTEKMAAINAAADLLVDHLTPHKSAQAGVG